MTTPELTAPGAGLGLGAAVRRFLARGPFELTLWAIIVVSWLFLMVRTDWNLLEISVWTVPFLLLIAAASTPWRSIRWRTVFGFFMIGMGPVFFATALVAWALEAIGVEGTLQRWLFDTGLGLSNVRADVIAPVLEELFKVAPLLIILAWRRNGFGTTTGPLDYAVLAGATGAGMSFAEDIFVYLSQGALAGPPGGWFGLGVGRVYAGLVGAGSGVSFSGRSAFADNGSFFFPEMQELNGYVWAGHGALALAIGLSVGLAVWWSRRYGSRLFYALPVVVYLWAVSEHVMANWYGGSGCASGGDSSLCIVASINLRGRVLPFLLLAGLGYAAWVSGRQLRAHRDQDLAMRLPWNEVSTQSYAAKGVGGWMALLADRFGFLRWRRRVGYGAFHLAHVARNTRGQLANLMASRITTLVLRDRLRGAAPDPVPAAISNLTPIP